MSAIGPKRTNQPCLRMSAFGGKASHLSGHRQAKLEAAMKIQYAVALALATGLAVGAVAMQGLQARATPPVYYVVEIDEVTDANGFEELRKTGPRNVVEVKYNDGRYIARTENITALDGAAPKYFAFIAFANKEKVKAFVTDMKDTTALRNRVTKSRSFIVEGLPE